MVAHDGGIRMYHIDAPNDMTPKQRFNEIAFILSKGYIRLKQLEIMERSERLNGSDVSLYSSPLQSAHER